MKTMRASRYPKLLHFPMLILWATPLPIATVWMLLSASMLLLLRHYYVPEGIWSAVMQGAAEVIAYGTAVKLK